MRDRRKDEGFGDDFRWLVHEAPWGSKVYYLGMIGVSVTIIGVSLLGLLWSVVRLLGW